MFPKIYIYTLLVCLFVSTKRQNGLTDEAQILCGTSREPREGLWMIKSSKICLPQNSIFNKFSKSTNFFLWNPRTILFYNVYKENMFIIEIEDRREAS